MPPVNNASTIVIEKTPAYFTTRTAPKRVYRYNHKIKLLLIVRDPTTRAISDYSQVRENKLLRHKEVKSFEKLAFDNHRGVLRTVSSLSYRLLHKSVFI